MMMPAARQSGILPLLAWNELREIDLVEARRRELRRRIVLLPPRSHRRVELEARLRELTAQQLVLSARIGSA